MKKLLMFIILSFSLISTCFAQFGVGATGYTSIPSGEFSDFYNAGFGGSGRITYFLHNDKQVYFNVGYHQWKFDNSKFNKWFKNNGGVGEFDLDAPVTAIPLLIGLKYIVADFSNLKTYIDVSAGYYLIKAETSGEYKNNGQSLDVGDESENFEELALGIGAGIMIPLAKKLNADIGVKVDFITDSEAVKSSLSDETKDYYKEKNVTTFLIFAGVSYQF